MPTSNAERVGSQYVCGWHLYRGRGPEWGEDADKWYYAPADGHDDEGPYSAPYANRELALRACARAQWRER